MVFHYVAFFDQGVVFFLAFAGFWSTLGSITGFSRHGVIFWRPLGVRIWTPETLGDTAFAIHRCGTASAGMFGLLVPNLLHRSVLLLLLCNLNLPELALSTHERCRTPLDSIGVLPSGIIWYYLILARSCFLAAATWWF